MDDRLAWKRVTGAIGTGATLVLLAAGAGPLPPGPLAGGGGAAPLHPYLGVHPNGAWVVAWGDIERLATAIAWDERAGERNHVLHPRTCLSCGVVASIFPPPLAEARPAADSAAQVQEARQEAARLAGGQFVAKIVSFGDFAPLGLRAGDNYLFVWRPVRLGRPDQDGWVPPTHMAVLNAKDRTLIGFEFQPHGGIGAVGAGGPTHTLDDSTLSVAALRCRSNGWRACFVDSREVQQYGPFGGGFFGVGMPPAQLFSQPWVSCARYGCCCGGTNCHS